MRKTYLTADLSMIDTTAKKDGVVSAEHAAILSDVSYLAEDGASPKGFMCLGLNMALLDGTYSEAGISCGGYITGSVSDENGACDGETIRIVFSTNHSSAALTLYFVWLPFAVQVTYYQGDETLLQRTYYPDSYVYAAQADVENYTAVDVTILSTFSPHCFGWLYRIDYGTYFNWTDSEIMSATITEEVNPISTTLAINTATLKVYCENNGFDLANLNGVYKFLQTAQKITLTEYVNGEAVNMGAFYLDKPKSEAENEITFSCVDALGILDKTTFRRGRIYTGDAAKVVLQEIMDSAGWEDFELSEELADQPVYGYIGLCKHREALQQLVFALGAVADCSRSSRIRIYRVRRSIISVIGRDRKFISGSKVEKRDYYSGVSLTVHSLIEGTEAKQLYSGTLESGTYTIDFSNPCQVSSAEGANIIEKGINYCVITVEEKQTVKITGKQYEDVKSVYTLSADYVQSGQKDNKLEIDKATLVTGENADVIAARVYEYYSLQQQLRFRYIMENEKCGNWHAIYLRNKTICSCIEKQTIDLTGGFLADATCVGIDTQTYNYEYMPEIIAGQEIGVI